MYAEQFGAEYQTHSREAARRDPNPERRQALSEVRQWSTQYSDLLLGYLNGELADPDHVDTINRQYTSWHHNRLGPILDTLEHSPVDDDGYYSRALNETGFHLLNVNMLGLWKSLLTGREKVVRQDVERSQCLLAFTGTEFVAERTQAMLDLSLFDKTNTQKAQLYSSFSGISSEIDAAITLLELSKNNPHIAVVPSPGQFEHGQRPSMNSDFIVVDLKEREVRGVQMKSRIETTLNDAGEERYDDRFVTLIDGNRDLDNIRWVRFMKNSSKERVISWPGYIAMHHLISQKNISQLIAPQPHSTHILKATYALSNILRAKHHARELLGTTRSSNQKAAQVVAQRVLHDLYKNDDVT